MKPLHHEILELVRDRIGPNAPDEKLIDAADATFGAAVGLMASVRSNRARELALAERDAKTAELIRQAVRILDALERGQVQLSNDKGALQ
jgi:hypothetical protein